MKVADRLSEFLEFLDGTHSMEALGAGTLTVIGHYRLSVVASGIIAGSKAATPERFHFAHWPPGLLERYMSEDLQALDPIPRWARGTGAPAAFSQIFQRLKPKDPGRRVIQIAKEYGCVEGICVPMRAADGAIGVVSMVGDRSEFSPEEFRDLVAIGSLVFRRAEFINHSADRAQGAPILTLREIELLPFLVHGHSDREIAVLNGISEATVRFHLKNARVKIGAVSRAHLAAKVVALGFASL
jgi:LuxR family transcriptional regulator, activator of conjugal transfer of Ti plasmids